jgi:hypothetical protein
MRCRVSECRGCAFARSGRACGGRAGSATRYFPREVRDEARAVFPATVVPRDFDAIDVPFPERGEPTLVQPDREPAPA